MKRPTELNEYPDFFEQLREALDTRGSLEREELSAYLKSMVRLEQMPEKLRKRIELISKKDYSDAILCIWSYEMQHEPSCTYIHFGVDTDGVIYELVDADCNSWTGEYPSGDAQDSSQFIEADPSRYNAAELDAYEQYAREAPGLLQERLAADKEEIESYLDQIKRVDAVRIEGYGLNIIPEPYRDKEAVSYLSTFISTSRESFTTALHHYGMELATARLDTQFIVISNITRRIDKSVQLIAEREKELGGKVDHLERELAESENHLERELAEFENRLMSMLDTISFRLNPNLYH